jgi:hypothetical protein
MHLLRVGGKSGLSSARQTEVKSSVAVLADVGGAVHGHDSLAGQPVVHHGEDALLHLTSVEGAADDSQRVLHIEADKHLAVETVFLPLVVGDVAAVDDLRMGEIM